MQAVLAFLQRIWNVLKEYWQKTERNDRVRFIIICSVAFIGVIVVIVLLTRVNYVTLYTGMSQAEVGEISELLTAQGTRYQLGEDGTTILVPEGSKNSLLTSLAVQGYPKTGYAYDLLTENAAGFGVSESDKKMWQRIQREQNLSITLLANPLITAAHVEIAVPDRSGVLYADEIIPVTASVSLTLRDKLTKESINGIIALVSASWPDLAPENVRVIDQYMNLLSEVAPTSIDIMASQEEMRLQIQAEFERNLMSIFVPIYGADHVRAKCNVTLNFDDVNSESVAYTPSVDTEGVVESLHKITENATGGATGGQPGIEDNGGDIPLYDETTTYGDSWSSTTETINYLVNQTVETVKRSPYVITDIKATVAIDTNDLVDANNNEANIQAAAGGILGLERSDYNSISVIITPFSGVESEAAAYEEYLRQLRLQRMYDLIRVLALYLVLGVCLLVIIWRVFKMFHKGPTAEELLEMQRAAEMEELDEYADLVKLAATAEDIEATKTPERMKVEDFVERSPDMVANLLRNWLSDENAGRRR